MSSAGAGRNVFLTRALEKILLEREIKRSQHLKLRKSCESTLNEIKAELKKAASTKLQALPGGFISADKYFLPFELACKSNVPRIIITSLDCIQKLMAYGQLRGMGKDPDNPDKKLIDRVIDTICSCFIGVQTDEGVQLQIIKALLTALTCSTIEIHGVTLLQAIRCCYNIYLASKNKINRKTSKASLTQILSTLFQRMENEMVLQEAARRKMANLPAVPAPDAVVDTVSVVEELTPAATPTHQVPNHSEAQPSSAQSPRTRGSLESGSGHKPASSDGQGPVEVELHSYDEDSDTLVKTSKRLVTSAIANAVQLIIMEARASPEVSVVPPEVPSSAVAAAGTVSAMEPLSLPNAEGSSRGVAQVQFSHILEKDCFMVFRSLCKLSMKGVSDIHDSKSHELRSKKRSLKLLLSILEHSGPVFRTDDIFISGIKQYLCVTLSKNGVSSVPKVFQLSLDIFLMLFNIFKTHLKMQIEVFFKEIFLSILESGSSSFDHKLLVLEALVRICGDAQSVVDIYLNYDCDLSLQNLFERLIGVLSKIAQGRQAIVLAATHQQERILRAKGLECLCSILKCMVEWSRDYFIDPTTTGLNAFYQPSSAGEESEDVATASLGEVRTGRATSRMDLALPTGEMRPGRAASMSGRYQLSESGDGDGVSVSSMDNPEQFQSQKQTKETMESGIQLFSSKPKKGVKFLQQKKLVGEEPEAVAQLFHTDDRFSRTAIGDYLGEIDEYCKSVMYAYVDLIDFGNMDFVAALRHLLSQFRLPGESQKIDRIMEKFAGRYVENNKQLDIFASADTAYVLAYSIIMLTTDLHNSQVKKKMTKLEYIRMNRGINDQKDLPREYLEEIYDEIASREIRMNAQSQASAGRVSIVSEKQRRQVYSEEMAQVAETAKALMENFSEKSSTFTSATHVEHIRGMFKISWTPFLAAFSVALRDTEDQGIVLICLDAFRCAIRISCVFGLQLERNAYINSLAKFTMLTTSLALVEMKRKNIETIRSLCAVAYTDGNYLGDSWIDVLQCISQLELAQLIGSGVKTRYLTHGGQQQSFKAPRVTSSIDSVLTASDAKKMATIQEQVEETSSQSVVVAVDRIFTGSTRLDTNAIVDFVEALCAVSNQELSSPTHPRMFSLQKLIEICYYNMDRVRLEWSRMWEVIGSHFNTVGCLPSEEVSFFVVDSLRQLSMKFLEKGELANFRFQKDFLRPFEHIMKRNEAVTIRDMVVRCVAQMVTAKAGQVKSGWKNIFSVFHLAASDHDSGIVEMAFQNTDLIFKQHFSATIDSFQDAVKCLSEFSCNAAFPDTSMEAIRIIRLCAKHIADNPEIFVLSEDDRSNPDCVWVRAWFPVLFELSTVITRCNLDVRTRGLTVMFEIMKSYGNQFQQTWWQDLFKIVFRIFDKMKHPENQIERTEWMTTTCNHALYAMMDVFTQFFEVLSPVLLEDVLSQLLWCVQQDNEQLARSGTNCLENLAISIGRQFFPDTWDKVCQCMRSIYLASVPDQLLTWKPDDNFMTRSYSSLSVVSSKSSLTLDYSEMTQTPSSVTNISTLNDTIEQYPTDQESSSHTQADHTQADHPQADDGSEATVVVGDRVQDTVDSSAADGVASGIADGVASGIADGVASGIADGVVSGIADGVASGIADGVVVVDMEDQEFGSFVSVSTPAPNPDIESSPGNNKTEILASEGVVGEVLMEEGQHPPTESLTESRNHLAENRTQNLPTEDQVEEVVSRPPAPEINVKAAPPETLLTKGGKDSSGKGSSFIKVSSKLVKQNQKKAKSKLGKKLQGGTKKRKSDSHDKSMEDNQSELSYQADTDLSKSKISKKLHLRSPEQNLFNSMIIKCVVQLELIQAIDNILFFPNTTRHEDTKIVEFSKNGVMVPPPLSSEKGMFKYLSSPQLMVLVNCLEEAHLFSRVFNSNNEQRTLLMKAGFRGKTRPNLLRQETTSIMCALRILYHMLTDEERMQSNSEVVESRLLQLVNGGLEYFLGFTSEVHREAWTPVLLLMFVRMLQLQSHQFKSHMKFHYQPLCQLIGLGLKEEVRILLKSVFSRIGHEFDISTHSMEAQDPR